MTMLEFNRFFATPKNEMYYRKSYTTRKETRLVVIDFVGCAIAIDLVCIRVSVYRI